MFGREFEEPEEINSTIIPNTIIPDPEEPSCSIVSLDTDLPLTVSQVCACF